MASFTTLMAGWVLDLRRHTVTEVVRAAGAVGRKHISSHHRFFSRACWTTDEVGLTLSELPEGVVMDAFERIRTALAARVVTQRRPLPDNQVGLGPIDLSDDLKFIEIRSRDARGVAIYRHYAGYVGNV